MTRFATAFALALVAAGTVSAQAETFSGRDVTAAPIAATAPTTGAAKTVAAGEVFDAKTLASLGLEADATVAVTAFETTGAIETSSTR